MRYFMITAASVFIVLGIPTPVARAAPADVGVDRCVVADTTAQSLRREGKFGAAIRELAMCVDASCPALVRDDCNQRLDELERAQPTIVLDAKDNEGHDLSDVTVEIDGRPFAQRLDGIALAVDPGEHTFTFEMKGGASKVTQKFVLREGEKGRREQILVGGAASPVAAGGPPPRGSSHVQPAPLGAQRLASLVTLGVGLVGIGAGAALAVEAKAKAKDADAYCPRTTCANDAAVQMNHDARVAGNLATVAFAVGAAGVAGAVVLWLTAKPSPTSPGAELALVGGTLRLRGTW